MVGRSSPPVDGFVSISLKSGGGFSLGCFLIFFLKVGGVATWTPAGIVTGMSGFDSSFGRRSWLNRAIANRSVCSPIRSNRENHDSPAARLQLSIQMAKNNSEAPKEPRKLAAFSAKRPPMNPPRSVRQSVAALAEAEGLNGGGGNHE